MNPDTLSQISRKQKHWRCETYGWTCQCWNLGSQTRTICRIGSHATRKRETGLNFLTESPDYIHLNLFLHMIIKLLNILRFCVNRMIIRHKQFENCLPETYDYYTQALDRERHRSYVILLQDSHAKLSLWFRTLLRCNRWLTILRSFCELFPYKYLARSPARKLKPYGTKASQYAQSIQDIQSIRKNTDSSSLMKQTHT